MSRSKAKAKENKNHHRRALKKEKKQETKEDQVDAPKDQASPSETRLQAELKSEDIKREPDSDPEVEDVDPVDAALDRMKDEGDTNLLEHYRNIFGKFQPTTEDDSLKNEPAKPEVFFDDADDGIPDEDDPEHPSVSKKKRKQQMKLSVAQLKSLVYKPELVEWTDTSSQDPRLLVAIKASRNVVPVPNHWSLKREYLSSKRGIEKRPFALPKYIQDTGIQEMRDAVLEKQDQATLKQKQRERVQPKMGKLDIDYQKLYEAFFKFQTKPDLTRFGEVYYEGKEYETNLRHLRPGELSDELKEALNMPPNAPPPWLLNQQRVGPPPSYPALKIPGLNAPPPIGASWGFQPGQWGKPPVDDLNRPLYGGEVFGSTTVKENEGTNLPMGEPIERNLWGELEDPEEEEEEEESEEEENDEEDDEGDTSGMQTSGAKTSGTASVEPSVYGGMESVQGNFTLRKEKRGTETDASSHPRTAGQIIPEQNVRAQGFFGSDRTYDMKGVSSGVPVLGQEDRPSRKRKAGDVDVSVDVDALERDDKLSKEEVSRRYESQRKAEAAGPWGAQVDDDDLSNMIAEESNKRLKKDQERRRR